MPDIQSIPIWVFVIVGFIAQMIDGALGMAYGVSSTTILTSLGVPQKFASAAVHASEVVTTGISGFSHWRAGNIHFDLAKQLVIPGVLGGVIGAYLLSNFEGDILKSPSRSPSPSCWRWAPVRSPSMARSSWGC